MNIIWLIIYLAIIGIAIVFVKEFFAYIGVPIPRIVWVAIGCIAAILLLLWFGGLIGTGGGLAHLNVC